MDADEAAALTAAATARAPAKMLEKADRARAAATATAFPMAAIVLITRAAEDPRTLLNLQEGQYAYA